MHRHDRGGQSGSKWLRDEEDADWAARFGRDNNISSFTGENQGGYYSGTNERRDLRRDGGNLNKLLIYDKNGRKVSNSGPD